MSPQLLISTERWKIVAIVLFVFLADLLYSLDQFGKEGSNLVLLVILVDAVVNNLNRLLCRRHDKKQSRNQKQQQELQKISSPVHDGWMDASLYKIFRE